MRGIRILLLFSVLANARSQYIPGDCQQLNSTVLRYEVLPGSGWDNLKNENKGRVIQFNYNTCQISDDGVYLVPDGVFLTPIKSSDVEKFAKIIEHVENDTSDVAASVNVQASFPLDDILINGKFSLEYQNFKMKMVKDNSTALKVKAHYVQYNAKMRPGMELDPTFKARVSSIANHVLNNRTSSARYESDLLVRDYGTHVISSVDAGASIVKVDHVKRSLFEDATMDKYQISAAAGAEFFGVQVGISMPVTTMTKYLTAKTHSNVRTNGGPIFKPINFTLNDWVDQIDQNLVPVDRSGDPLHFVINMDSLPEMSANIIEETASMIEKSIKTYFKLNTHRGCTDRDSPNFNYMANVDDGTCNANITSTNFGGVFQTCNVSGNINDICSNYLTKNPITGDFTCPSGFKAVPLYKGQHTRQGSTRSCSSYLIFWKHCQTTSYFGIANYQSFWCVTSDEEPTNTTGYLFGGLFTSQYSNVATQQKSCPQYFTPLLLAGDLSVCVSDDFENGFDQSIPFNGFYSCQQTNPLAVQANKTSCDSGFSQHLASIVDECEVNFCARFKPTFGYVAPIRSPPFAPRPSDNNDTFTFVVSNDGQSWTQIYAVPNGFEGFNGTNSSWMLNSGDFLDNHDLLVARQQQQNSRNNAMKKSNYGQNFQEQHGVSRTHNDHESGELSLEQIIGVVGGSVGITLSFVLFISFFVYLFRSKSKNVPVNEGYTKMKA